MSHRVDTMAFVGEVPWWGLGKNLNPGELVQDKHPEMATRDGGALGRFVGGAGTLVTGEEMLKAAELDWTVGLRPILASMGDGVLASAPSDFQAVVRLDTSLVLGVVGSRYCPVQNAELFAIQDVLVKEGLISYETAGSLNGGRMVWSLARMGEWAVTRRDGRQDLVKSFLLWASDHTGKGSVIAGRTDVRVVCANTLDAATGGLQGRKLENRVRIRHTRSASARVAEAHRTFAELVASQSGYQAAMHELVDKAMTKAAMVDFANAWLDDTQGALDAEAENFKARQARREQAVAELQTLFTDGLGNTGEDCYDAFNAVTQWLDHRREEYRTTAMRQQHMASTLLGDRYKRKGRALAMLTKG